MLLLAIVLALALALSPGAVADQASQPGSTEAAQLDAGRNHTCALLAGTVRCWGFGYDGELGYGNKMDVGDDETPGSVGPVQLGLGRTATAISAGGFHTCALLDNGTVRCWGFGADGRLGYGNTNNVGDDETPASVPTVDLGPGRTATAISAGFAHTCAILDNGSVRCWGYGVNGAIGQGGQASIGDNETPGSLPPVDLGAGRTARAISAGNEFTCALLDNYSVRCWGYNLDGRLGYGDRTTIGDNETPGSVGPVDLGAGRTARAISAGDLDACALLDNGTVRCWGVASHGSLGYGNANDIGDNETPGSVGSIDLGPGRTARAISVGGTHACTLLDNGDLRCWGENIWGQLGYGNTLPIGDDEIPAAAGPVDLGQTMTAISAGRLHTCARMSDASVRCWGYGGNGRLGLCGTRTVGDDEPPLAVGPVKLDVPSCGGSSGGSPIPPVEKRAAAAYPLASQAGQAAQAARMGSLRACLSKAARHTRREIRRARSLTGAGRARARRHIKNHRARLHRRCLRRWGRTPGRVKGLTARGLSRTAIALYFAASGTDGGLPPPAQGYLVKQSRQPIRNARAFRRARTLCDGSCRFPTASAVGDPLTVTITDLRPRTRYYYAVAAQDNVSCRLGPRSRTAARTLASDPPPPPHQPSAGAPPPSGGSERRARDCTDG